MNLSASVMAHPTREAYVGDLLTRLDRPVEVVWDTGRASRHKSELWQIRRAALMLATGDWHLVLQDDALPCPDLLAGMERALKHVPAGVGVVSPYLGTLRPHTGVFVRLVARAEAEGASWIRTESLWWGVAVAVRTSRIPELIEFGDRQRYLADDTRVGRFYRLRGEDTYYTWPSLVDHRDGPSLVGHGGGRRRAHRWHQGSALDLDFAGPMIRQGYGFSGTRRPGLTVRG